MNIKEILEKNEWWYSYNHWEKIAIACQDILNKAGQDKVIVNSVEWGELCGIDSRPLVRAMKKWAKKKSSEGITNSSLGPSLDVRIVFGETTKHGTPISISRL